MNLELHMQIKKILTEEREGVGVGGGGGGGVIGVLKIFFSNQHISQMDVQNFKGGGGGRYQYS